MPGKKLRLKKIIGKFFRKIDIRVVLVGAVLSAVACFLIYRLFVLQIINGQDYLDSFQLRIRRQIPIEASRGNIYDRNGNILAYRSARRFNRGRCYQQSEFYSRAIYW